MTAEEAKRHQDELAKHYNLGFWYGTQCNKCCGVYPKAMTTGNVNQKKDFWYECEVCGKRTAPESMPWVARDKWNSGQYLEDQISLDDWR